MDYSKIPRQDGLDYDQNNPSGMEGQEDNQPGKTSVFLKKVKAKAKKIKNAMKKKDGNVDQDNNQNDDETVEGHEEEELYYDDETVEDSQVHDSVPMNESPAVTNTSAGQNPGDNFEKPTVAAEDRYDSKYPDPQTRQFSQRQDEDIGKYGGSTGRSTATGVAEVHVPEKRDSLFSPSAWTFGTPGSDTEDVPLNNATKLPSNQNGYTEKLSYATSAIANQGIAAKNVVASKLGYGGNQDQTVASDTLSTRKQGGEGEEGENQKPVGIVTESEEVRERLGSDGDPNREMTETESKIAGNVSSPGKGGMVESVKDTVTSWFSGGGDQKQASEGSPGNTHGEEATTGYENGVGERRLQESGN